MRSDKIRRFKPRMNKFRSRRPSNGMQNNGIIHQNNIHRNSLSRNHVNKNPHNLERLVEKYKNLAKEALSSGDKILHENYLQHSDHFTRILSELTSSKEKHTSKEKNDNSESQNVVSEQN
tara:strand:+ start:121 stop:480 length:360 start_codon:yes stop_codon:yes gene_type:complete